MSAKTQTDLAPTTEEVGIDIDLSGVRGVLEGLFNQHPAIQKDINAVWSKIEVLGAQMESLIKTVGSLNRLVVLLKTQRDELVADNAQQWDDGYESGMRMGAIMRNHESVTIETIEGIIAENIEAGHFVWADEDDIVLFCRTLMSGEFYADEGESLSDLVMAVANRMREQVDFGEADDGTEG